MGRAFETGALGGLRREGRADERGVDALALAGALAVVQRRAGAERREQRRHQVGHGHRVVDGFDAAALLEGEAGERLHRAIERGDVRPGRPFVEAGHGDVDDAGIEPSHRVVVDAQAARGGGAIVLDDDIAVGGEAAQHLRAAGEEIERERAFALVPAEEAEREHPEWVALRLLRFDHVRSQHREVPPRRRSGDEGAEVRDTDTGEQMRPGRAAPSSGGGPLGGGRLGQHCGCVFAEQGGAGAYRARRRLEGEGDAHHADFAQIGVLDGGGPRVLPQVVAAEELIAREHGRRGDGGLAQDSEPLVTSTARERRLEDRGEERERPRLVRPPGPGRQARVVDEVGVAGGLEQPVEVAGRAAGDEEPAPVRGAVGTVGGMRAE